MKCITSVAKHWTHSSDQNQYRITDSFRHTRRRWLAIQIKQRLCCDAASVCVRACVCVCACKCVCVCVCAVEVLDDSSVTSGRRLVRGWVGGWLGARRIHNPLFSFQKQPLLHRLFHRGGNPAPAWLSGTSCIEHPSPAGRKHPGGPGTLR